MFKPRKTDTQSIARVMSDESKNNIDHVREIRNASYKSGFAMAATILRNHLRDVERGIEPINIGKLITWTEACQHWRKTNDLDCVPDIV